VSEKRYYSIRTGKHPLGSKLNLDTLLKMFLSIFCDFERRGYFQEAFGHTCVDAGWVPGIIGEDISAYFLIKLRKDNLWKINDNYLGYTEEDLFDVIELLFDCVSKPIDGWYHSYGDCGMHYKTFEKKPGQDEFRNKLNEVLKDYKDGYELSKTGEIWAPVVSGMEVLFESELPEYDEENINRRVASARDIFRRHSSSLEDKRNAIKMLADVLEFLRPKLKTILSANDEKDLFEIANSFGIRHHNLKQKTGYDQSVWFDWMFYYYLATIDTAVRLIAKQEKP
jgi:hypothetical protein